ncbi:hypothetical protein GCM10011297_02500 [Bacterioplanes sanyensis]|uniref:SulA-like leucine-rich domain-containing protein n=1 Tax=Bacterioplanes sanyensis TaxID=1249553 RepID=UPI001674E13D|nr:SulA-like leucine-rich domain-containing protein [Bacterioplanes sanyensis]GGY33051.1 hypothetical protein GCM10011297_02500 [Bacterioplanes sanyensis]
MQPAALSRQRPQAFAQLPASGSLTEMILSDGSAINPMQLLPLLSQCNHGQRWLLWLSPHPKMNKQWLQSLGLHQAAVIQLDCHLDNQFARCLRAIDAGNSHLLIEWQGPLSVLQRQQLEDSARSSQTEVVLIRRRTHLEAA